MAFAWADSCPNKKYKVEIHTYDAVSNKEVVDCPVAVINENNNSDSLVSPTKLYLYPGTYTARATIGLNQAEKTFTVQDAAMTVQITGENNVLSGQVSDKYTGRTIEGAAVLVNQGDETLFTTTTNVIGEYSVELPDGDYRVIFMADGYESQVYPLTLHADKNLDVKMQSEPYTLSFDANGGSGIMGDVEFHHGQTVTLPTCTFTPPEGKVFAGWLIGNEVICDAGTDYAPSDGNHTLTATWMEKSHTVTVTVLNTSGNPVSGQAIAGTGLDTAPVTGTDGTVTFELDVGTYKLSATDSNSNYDSEEIEVTEDTTVTLKLHAPTDPEWSFDPSTGLLTITGDGPMPNYSGGSSVPWYEHKEVIKSAKLSGVTTVGKSAFSGCNALTSIDLPDNLTYIGWSAFSDCRALTSITIPDGVTELDGYAFADCRALTSIDIPDSVTKLGDNVFYRCLSLTKITLSDNCKKIPDYAFFNCYSVTSITIPEGVTHIGIRAFENCFSLTSISFPDTLTLITDYAFQKCTSLTSIDLPNNCKYIYDYAFAYCTSLASISLPENSVTIGDYVFQNCEALTSIVIPDGWSGCGLGAFWNCKSLKSVYFPVSIMQISQLFRGCTALTDIYYGGSVEEWENIRISGTFTDVTIHYNSTAE